VAHLAAGALVPDRAGFKPLRAVERRLYFFLRSHLKDGLRSRVNRLKIFSHNVLKLLPKGDASSPDYKPLHYTKKQAKKPQEVYSRHVEIITVSY
jgi:hypothetical protein